MQNQGRGDTNYPDKESGSKGLREGVFKGERYRLGNQRMQPLQTGSTCFKRGKDVLPKGTADKTAGRIVIRTIRENITNSKQACKKRLGWQRVRRTIRAGGESKKLFPYTLFMVIRGNGGIKLISLSRRLG